MASAWGEPRSLSQFLPERKAAEAEPKMGSEGGGRGRQEHSLMPAGQNTACAISQASLVQCSGHSQQGLVQPPPNRELQARPSHPSMKDS